MARAGYFAVTTPKDTEQDALIASLQNGGGVSVMTFMHTATSGTNGGPATPFVNSWSPIPLNETNGNIQGASLSSQVITLPAGNYFINGHVPINGVARGRARLYNNTTSQTILLGVGTYANNGFYDVALAKIQGSFTLLATTNLTIQLRVEVESTLGDGSSAIGLACGWGDTEIYSTFSITKI